MTKRFVNMIFAIMAREIWLKILVHMVHIHRWIIQEAIILFFSIPMLVILFFFCLRPSYFWFRIIIIQKKQQRNTRCCQKESRKRWRQHGWSLLFLLEEKRLAFAVWRRRIQYFLWSCWIFQPNRMKIGSANVILQSINHQSSFHKKRYGMFTSVRYTKDRPDRHERPGALGMLPWAALPARKLSRYEVWAWGLGRGPLG